MQWTVRLLQVLTAVPVIWLGIGLISANVEPPKWVPLWMAAGAVGLIIIPNFLQVIDKISKQ